ncbi:hypothetical protein D3C78_1129880 [compost metagenome]
MRHEHRVGKKLFVDYADQMVPAIACHRGEIRKTLFVTLLAASSYTLAEATSVTATAGLTGFPCPLFRPPIGGVPEIVVLETGAVR